MRFESFYVLSTDASLIEVVGSLWSGGDVALALIVALVSLIFPAVKLVLIAVELIAAERQAGQGMLVRLVRCYPSGR